MAFCGGAAKVRAVALLHAQGDRFGSQALRPDQTTGRRIGELATLIGGIYEAAVQPDGWTEVVASLRTMFGLTFATMATYSADRSRVQARAVGIEQSDYESFLAKYFRINQFSPETDHRVAGSIVPSRSFFDPAVFQRKRHVSGVPPRPRHG